MFALTHRYVYRRIRWVQPALRYQPQRRMVRNVIAKVNLDKVIAGHTLILSASKGIQILTVERAQNVLSHRCRYRPPHEQSVVVARPP